MTSAPDENLGLSAPDTSRGEPRLDGNLETQKHFLEQMGVDFTDPWTFADTECAHRTCNAYVQSRRANGTPKRPLADILIGAPDRSPLRTRPTPRVPLG